jgi:hypothetical protein
VDNGVGVAFSCHETPSIPVGATKFSLQRAYTYNLPSDFYSPFTGPYSLNLQIV